MGQSIVAKDWHRKVYKSFLISNDKMKYLKVLTGGFLIGFPVFLVLAGFSLFFNNSFVSYSLFIISAFCGIFLGYLFFRRVYGQNFKKSLIFIGFFGLAVFVSFLVGFIHVYLFFLALALFLGYGLFYVRNDKNLFFSVVSLVIPLIILVVLLFLNFNPYPVRGLIVLDVGSEDDTKGVFRLEESNGLGSRQGLDGDYLRAIDGLVYAVYEPLDVMRDVLLNVSVFGNGVYLIGYPDVSDWDYVWDDFSEFRVESPMSVYYQLFYGREVFSSFNDNFAVIIDYVSSGNESFLNGNIKFNENIKEIRFENIVFNIPDYYIGKQHEIVAGFIDGFLYLFIDGNFIGKSKFDKKFNVSSKYRLFDFEFDIYERPIFIDSSEYFKNQELKDALNRKDFSFLRDFIVFDLNDSNQKLKSRTADNNFCAYFDGSTRYILPNSSNSFKDGSFAVFVSFVPEKKVNSQQIIGHLDWEIYQQTDKITFQVGRMNNNKGAFHSVSYSIDDNFLNKSHSILAIYNPFDNKTVFDGYIELFVDDVFAGRTYFKEEKIWSGYSKQDLSLGHTVHSSGNHPKFEGFICDVKFVYDKLDSEHNNYIYNANGKDFKIPINGNGNFDKLIINKRK
jgi:hypothetical protein